MKGPTNPEYKEDEKCQKDEKLLKIKFVENHNLLIIKGWSITPELNICYQSTRERIERHLSLKEGLTIYFSYELLHSVTTRFLYETVQTLNQFHTLGKRINIHWIINQHDDHLIQLGAELKALCHFSFNLSLPDPTLSSLLD
ncbi:MAG: SiaC family regulatory phosphoprotein [Marinoscillum sp.]|uniref:SiaC family regulatory phosphoprotein n=1 Tax=Marinoscillum sp. TaxID=2024838 RepID=UPI0033001369